MVKDTTVRNQKDLVLGFGQKFLDLRFGPFHGDLKENNHGLVLREGWGLWGMILD